MYNEPDLFRILRGSYVYRAAGNILLVSGGRDPVFFLFLQCPVMTEKRREDVPDHVEAPSVSF